MRPRHSVGHSHPDAPFPQFAPVSHVKFSVRPSSLSQRHPACCNSCSRTPEWSDCQCAGAFPKFTVPKPQKKRPKSKRTVLPSVSVKDFLRMYATRSFFLFFFFFFFALHSTPHGARRYLQGGGNTRLLIHYTTQRGGGCVVAQGDVLPICLAGCR
jgi:hypothetical protein